MPAQKTGGLHENNLSRYKGVRVGRSVPSSSGRIGQFLSKLTHCQSLLEDFQAEKLVERKNKLLHSEDYRVYKEVYLGV